MKVDRVKPATLNKILKDFTLEELSQAQPEDLTDYKGIGTVTAWRIIVAARKEVKEQVAEKPVEPDMRWAAAILPPPPPGLIVQSPFPKTPPTVESARVRRIREGMEG